MSEILIIILIIAAVVGGIFIYMLFAPQHEDANWKLQAKTNLNKVRGLTTSNDESKLKTAVIEADKLLDYVLKSKKVKGETLGDRLKSSKNLFSTSSYNKVWEVHKLRNRLAHEMNFNPDIRYLKSSANSLLSEISDIL
ncbi:MAG: hypothetical protein ABIM99_06190 [Candidatus Dojkabacteria bacterium]